MQNMSKIRCAPRSAECLSGIYRNSVSSRSRAGFALAVREVWTGSALGRVTIYIFEYISKFRLFPQSAGVALAVREVRTGSALGLL